LGLKPRRNPERFLGINMDISERKAAETRLQESEKRYASLTAAAPVGIFHTDATGRCTYVNDRYCQIAGLSREEAAGEGWQQGLHPDDREKIIVEWERSVQENCPFQLEYRFQHPEGAVRWVYGQAVAERDTQDEIIGYVGIITDISDRKEAEAQIQEMTQRLALATNAANIGVWDFDPVADRLIWDERMYELYGISANEFSGAYEAWQQGVHPEDMALAHDSVQAAITGERDFHTEFRVVWPNGQIRFIEAHAIVLRDEEGNARRMIGVNWDISDRKEAEADRLQAQKIRLELKLLEQLFDIILAGYWDWDIVNQQAYLSPSFKRMFGYEDDELPNTLESWQNSIFPEDLPSVLDCFHRHIRSHGQIPFYNEVRYRHKNGSTVWAICSGQVIEWDKEGNALRIIGFNMNISDRKQTEAHLRQLSARLNLAVESAAIGIWDWDISTNILLWDRQMHDLYGIAPQDFAGVYEAWLERVHPEDRQTTATAVGQALKSGMDFNREFRIVHPDDSIRFIQANALVQYDDRGEPQRMIGINYDITERQKTEQIIRQQAEREKLLREITQKIRQSLDIQTIFDTACQEIRSVLQVDRVGIFKFAPDSGFSEGTFVAESVVAGFDSVVGILVRDRCFGEDYAALYSRGRILIADDIYQNGFSPCHTDILAQFKVRACMVMPLPCGQELWGLLCVHQCESDRHWQQAEIDFTQQLANQIAIAIQQANLYEQLQEELNERQQAQQLLTERNQQLAISNEELARATRLKDEFLANMSHELRTPLNAILGMTEGLQDAIFGEVNKQQLKAVQTIKQSGSYLLELIDDILDLAKIESGQIELEIAPTAVAPLCRSSLAFIKQQSLKKRIQVEIDLLPNLPDLLVDERRIRQVLINLLANAVKFTPEGGRITLKVSHQWISPPHLAGVTWMQSFRRAASLKSDSLEKEAVKYLRIAVIDTGIGIAPEHMDKLFQPFVQIDSTLNRQYTGTGLGLALVKRIIELHGGEVGLSSEVRTGSCFTISLPCTRTANASPEPDSRQLRAIQPKQPEGQGSPLILLVEDNEANIVTVSSYLRAKGYRLLVAKNGLEAIALTQNESPHLILMDIQMPKMDGLTAIEKIRRDLESAIPIIALTALAMPGDRDRCLEVGADRYLSKPIKLQQLVATIQQLLVPREEPHANAIPFDR
jgi:PAS domain S-box-containing protein